MLKITDIKKTYPGFTLDCSLDVKPGRITGLIGENGAGKTTLFKTALGLRRPDSGSITLFGKQPDSLTDADRQLIGAVFAEGGFSEYLRVGDVKKILRRMYTAFDEPMFDRLCASFALPKDKMIKEYSTGMKVKLKLLVALTHSARLLILDEPTAGLDVLVRDSILSLLRDYMGEADDRAILISSHISSDLEMLCDDFYMIHQGKVICHEDTDRLLGSYAVLKVDEGSFAKLDTRYILRKKAEPFGYSCLTDRREFYRENYPDLIIEKSGLDQLMLLMIRGEKV